MSGPTAVTRAVSLAARMPGPLLPVGVMAAAAASTGSMFTTATLTAAALVGISISAPAASASAERFGARNVLLVSAIAHVLMLVLMVSSVDRLTRGDTLTSGATIYTLLLLFTLIAGLSTPAVATFSRADTWTREKDVSVWHGLRVEGRLDDAAFIAAPLLVVGLSFSFGTTVGLLSSAVLTAVAVPLYAVNRADPLEVPAESARLPLGGAEHAQQQLMEHRNLQPAHAPDWGRGISAAITLAAALGFVLGGLWVSVLDAAQALIRPSLFALTLGLMAAAAVLGARWKPSRFAEPLALRRRRLHVVALLGLSLLLVLLAVVIPVGLVSLLALSGIAVLQSAALGRLVLGLYAGLAVGVPTSRLPVAIPAVAGGVLSGIALGLTLAGIGADGFGLGAPAAVALTGSLLAGVVVFSGQLWGSPESSAGRPTSAPDGD
ncbi:hypothetical protein [Nesterenkonia sp. CF4.4]|uniref:hypothetical protein n=1 Tax=Nesterenkonia sp. CF4.4 TaxID=3373079 RepID=UPI003EE6A016